MVKPVYFTICSKNYLAYALTLGRSLRDADPAASFKIFLADTQLEAEAAESIEFEVIPAEQLDLPNLADMTLRYSIMEFNTAIKPSCFKYLFELTGSEAAVYLDPDILVLRPLEHVEQALDAGSELVLTPHSLSPLDDGGDPDDLRLLRTGVYNLGFVAFAHSPETMHFLDWWKARLATDCRVALDDGIFVDQKWMDLAPCYVERSLILRHPGYNAAYWNLYGRPVMREAGMWKAGGKPLHFFHFSGVKPGDGTVFSKHQTRFRIEDVGDLVVLLHDYLQRLERNGHALWSREPYGFALPDDLNGLDSFVRAAFRRQKPEACENISLEMSELETMCNVPSREVTGVSGGRITNLTFEIWAQRPDLRRTFDLSSQAGREDYNVWLMTTGVEEHEIPERFLRHITAPLAKQADLKTMPLRARLIHEGLKRRHIIKPLFRYLPARWVEASKRRVQGLISSPQRIEAVSGDKAGRISVPLAVYGYFNAESGLGEAVRREFRALRSAGMAAVARPVKSSHSDDRENFEFAFDTGASKALVHLVHVNADQTLLADDWAGPETFDEGHYRIGFWAWELEQFPEEWAPAFARVDEIWTPSHFVAAAVSAATPKPVRVFPHPVPIPEKSVLTEQARSVFALPRDLVLFLTIFDFNSYTERKNPMAVLEAFELARGDAPELGLILKCHGGMRHDAERERILTRARRMENVFIVDRVLTSLQMDTLYAACDGLISLHRSEGFGLTIAEAMARGLPVIATDYSGSREYFDGEVGEAVSYTLVDVEPGTYPHGEGACWAQPDIHAAAEALMRLTGQPDRRRFLGEKARERILERLSPDRIGREMAGRIDQILDQLESAARPVSGDGEQMGRPYSRPAPRRSL